MKQNPNAYIVTAKKLAEKGKYKEARKLLLQQLNLVPGYLPIIDQLSIISYQLKDFKTARSYCLDLLKGNKNSSELYNRLGLIELQEGSLKNAEQSFKHAISKDSKNYKSYYLLGKLYFSTNQYKNSINCILKSLEINPSHSKSYVLAAQIYIMLNDPLRAKSLLSNGYNNIPEDKEISYNLTKILFQLKDYESLINLYQSQLSNNPENQEVMLNMGLLYNLMGKKVIANEWFLRCMKSYSPITPMATMQFAYNSLFLCDWGNYDWIVNQVIDATNNYIQDDKAGYGLPIYILMHFDVPRSLYFEAAKKVSLSLKKKIEKKSLHQPGLTKKSKKIKLGYISTQFRKQAGGILYYDIFRHHDPAKFEVYVYSLIHKEDFVSQNIKNTCNHFLICENMSDKEVAEKIRNDGIDILVTTAGYYDEMRMSILAYQPAPIQVMGQGYNESTGSDFIQYAIVDQHIITSETEDVYTEKLIILPDCAMINSPLPVSKKATRSDFGLPEDKFVFASFNQHLKITRDTIKVWSHILENTKDSIIWIFNNDSEEARSKILKAFIDDGIAEDRIFFTGNLPMEKHWRRYQQADLYLDCFQFNAQATAIEALRNGLPILTLQGNTHNSRYGASILKNANLHDFICSDRNEYADKAIYYYENINALKEASKKLSNYPDIPLFNTSLKVKELEKAFQMVWQNHQDGLSSENVVI